MPLSPEEHESLVSKNCIQFVQIETGTACNYKCKYCPVAYHPRRGGFLPIDQIKKVVAELAEFQNVSKIYLNGYDEPTLNPRLGEIIELFSDFRGKIVLFTNGTHLTPNLADRIIRSGVNIDLDIHISATTDKDFYRLHKSRLRQRVLDNLGHLMAISPAAANVTLCVSAQLLDNPQDNETWREYMHYFNKKLPAFRWHPNDRAGILSDTEYSAGCRHSSIAGCSLENRTKHWLHINATGNVVLCCQDYFESHVLGNISTDSLTQILSSESRIRYHRWTIGDLESPSDYICRKCVFAIREQES